MNKMNEISQVIVLATEKNEILEDSDSKKLKCLLKYDNEIILCRLIRQLKLQGISKIVISAGYEINAIKELVEDDSDIELVENKAQEEYVSISGMKLALEHIDGACVVFDASMIMEDDLVKYVTGSDFEGKSVWFTKHRDKSFQYRGILKSDKYGNVTEIKNLFVGEYEEYSMLTGILRISIKELAICKKIINEGAEQNSVKDYSQLLGENLNYLKCEEADISHFNLFKFNSSEEYAEILNKKINKISECPPYELVPLEKLHDIEDYDRKRANKLIGIIEKSNIWNLPIIVENKHNMVLDGHHRLNSARKMKLKNIPVVYVDYDTIDVWTLRKEYEVSQKLVKQKVIDKKEIYPYKTVKHKFNFKVNNISVPLEELR